MNLQLPLWFLAQVVFFGGHQGIALKKFQPIDSQAWPLMVAAVAGPSLLQMSCCSPYTLPPATPFCPPGLRGGIKGLQEESRLANPINSFWGQVQNPDFWRAPGGHGVRGGGSCEVCVGSSPTPTAVSGLVSGGGPCLDNASCSFFSYCLRPASLEKDSAKWMLQLKLHSASQLGKMWTVYQYLWQSRGRGRRANIY